MLTSQGKSLSTCPPCSAIPKSVATTWSPWRISHWNGGLEGVGHALGSSVPPETTMPSSGWVMFIIVTRLGQRRVGQRLGRGRAQHLVGALPVEQELHARTFLGRALHAVDDLLDRQPCVRLGHARRAGRAGRLR